MIRTVSYSKGKAEEIEFKKVSLLRHEVWIDSFNPSLPELNLISEKTGISITDLKNCLDPAEKPRIENERNYSLIIFRSPISENNAVRTTPIGIFAGRRFVLTIHAEGIKSIDSLLANKETEKVLFKTGLDFLIYRLMMGIVRDFSLVLDKVEEDIDAIEDDVLKADNEKSVRKIFSSKKILLYFRKALIANRDVVNSIEKGVVKSIRNNEIFNDLYIEIMQLVDVEELHRDRLTGALEIYLSSVSNKMNQIMKSFSVIATLLLLPMLISGVYGMNFKFIPLAEHQYGFYITIGMMFVIMLLMVLFFKKRKWA